MIRSAVTVTLVEEARGGPFVFKDDLPAAISRAAALGFDAIEIFAPSADAIDRDDLHRRLEASSLQAAAFGTGAGWLRQRLTLTSPDASIRRRAIEFIQSLIALGAEFGAPAIIGSMQGRWGDGVDQPTAFTHLRDALNQLGDFAGERGVRLLYEPLNRYETNLCITLAAGVELLDSLKTGNVRLLADLFHMNIEETDIAEAIRAANSVIGHVHFVDSNRRPAGCGHLDYGPIVTALHEIGYDGYLSAEALAWPTPDEAAATTIQTFRRLFGTT